LSGFTAPFNLFHWSGTQSSELPTILFGLGAVALARQPDGVFQDIARRNFNRRERQRSKAQTRGAGAISEATALGVAIDVDAP
jgi:hypothetical protein